MSSLMLFAAVLIFGGGAGGLISMGKAVFDAQERLAAMPLADGLALFLPIVTQLLRIFAYGLGILVFAVWIEALARILATLKRLNAQES
jgi:hypothetical protein